MKTCAQLVLMVLALLLVGPEALSAGNNLLRDRNGGFEDGLAGWKVELDGEWAGKVEQSEIVSISSDARNGKKALQIDTTKLNPTGKIAGTFTSRKNPNYPSSMLVRKYSIRVSRRVESVKPKAWYLAKFHIRSDGVAIDEAMELMMDIKPWPVRWGGDLEKRHWESISVNGGRVFLPFSPIVDGKYHEHILLKEMYASTEALEVGVQILAPWTGKITIDDVELVEFIPRKDMTEIKQLLAMRGTKAITKVRRLHRETTLAQNGKAAAAILIPDQDAYRSLAGKIQAKVRELASANLPIVTKLQDVPAGAAIVALGSMVENDLVARLHFNRYVKVDGLAPGPGGYVVWTVAEPYGLAQKQNVIVVAGSDLPGQAAAVDNFCGRLATEGKTIRLPYLHEVFPKKALSVKDRTPPRESWGFHWNRERFAVFSRWYLPIWLRTGDLEAAKLARDEILKILKSYEEEPYFQTHWTSYDLAWAWDALEEAPIFSDADRLKITNLLLAYLHMRPQAGASNWETTRFQTNPAWNHQAKGVAGAYAMGRYFRRFYNDHDGRYDYYVKAAAHMFGRQALSSKPQENSGNYWLITMRFALSYYLGEWDKTFFEKGGMRRYAKYFATVANNKGWLSGFGDTYYCYDGWKSGVGLRTYEVPLAFWYYRDGRMLWWLKHIRADYENPHHQDVQPVEWKELLGVKKTPLERDLYDPGSYLVLWGCGGEGTGGPVGDVKYPETFDKISFRENWVPDGQYMLLEGIGRGIHSGHSTNEICKLSLLGEDLLIGSHYIHKQRTRTASMVNVARQGSSGESDDLNRKLRGNIPPYAALDATADLARTGFSRTALRGHQGGTDWYRNVFWLKGKYFALIDEVTARQAGTYYVESNLKSCPHPPKTGRALPIQPRTWRLLEQNRGFEVTYTDLQGLKQYILTDGASTLKTETTPARDLQAVMVRQVHSAEKLPADGKLTFINLMYADRDGQRKQYRLERISPTEAMIFEGPKPVAYFGSGQSARSKTILPIEAKMFLLTEDMLGVVDATSAGQLFRSETPASREIKAPMLGELLNQFSRLATE